jgi:hypothetical protein
VIGDVLAVCADRLGADATAVLARLGGPFGDAARVAARELEKLDDARAKRRRVEIATEANRSTLAAARGVDPSWIEATLAELPARARTAIAGTTSEPIDIWLARWVLALLPPMPLDPHAAGKGRAAELARWIAREPDALARWLRSIALDQLAFAMAPVPRTDDVPRELRLAAARIEKFPRKDALGPKRAALARCRDANLDDFASLVTVAGRALAPHLAEHALACMQLTRRLPYEDGIVLERALDANADSALDQVPTWDALFAQ